MINETDYRGRRVLVTGAAGFVGGALARRLVELGAEAHATWRQRTAEIPGVHWHQVELSDAAAVRDLLGRVRPDIVFHLAAESAAPRAATSVLPALRDNLLASVCLMQAALETGCRRVVLAGSADEPDHSLGPLIPPSPYAAAKFAMAAYARMYHALYGLPVVVARMFMVFGPGHMELKRFFPYTILSLLQGKSPRLTNGLRAVDWIFIEDMVAGYLALGLAPGILGETLDLGTGRKTTVRDVAEQLGQMINPAISLDFGALADRALELKHIDARVEQTAEKTGWRARIPLEEGMARTISWYQQQYHAGVFENLLAD